MSTNTQDSQERRINLKVPEELHHRLKIQAVRERKTLQDLVSNWLEEKLAQAEGTAKREPGFQ